MKSAATIARGEQRRKPANVGDDQSARETGARRQNSLDRTTVAAHHAVAGNSEVAGTMRRTIRTLALVVVWAIGAWFLQPARPAHACEEIWFTATSEQEGRTVIFRARKDPPCDIETRAFPFYISVLWPYKSANDGGMPDAVTNAGQIDLEDALITLDHEGHSYLMLVITGNGSKEWIWYARDFDDWIGRLNTVLKGHPVYPIDIEYQLDPEWSHHQAFIDWVPGTEQMPWQ